VKLSEIKSAKRADPPKIVVYGGPKVGKSTFAAGAPAPVAIQIEEGLGAIDVPAFPVARSWSDVTEAIGELGTQTHDYRTVIVDSLDWLEPLVHAEVCRVAGVAGIEKVGGGFGKGYVEADKLWREFLDGMDWLRSRGMTPVLIAHSEVRKVEPPDGDTYDSATLKLHKRAVGIVCEWADVIGYARHGVHVTASDDRTRALPTGKRTLCVGHHPAYVSGNRFGLTGDLPLDWAAFQAALDAARRI
jgi:hypothetical protein